MLNEDKISLMTEMAVYEKRHGKQDLGVFGYFRNDYIGWQIIKSVISATIAFAIIVGLRIFYSLEDIMVNIYSTDLASFGKGLLVKYLVFTLIYAVISVIIGRQRYRKAKMGLRGYYRDLKRLAGMYREEE